MNLEMFEDKNRFQLIRNRVMRLSDGSIMKQDLLSTLLLINVLAYIIGTMTFMWNNGLNELFQSFISHLFSLLFTINSFLDFLLGEVGEPIYWEPIIVPQLSFSEILSDIGLFLTRFIPCMILLFFIIVIFSREKFINEVIIITYRYDDKYLLSDFNLYKPLNPYNVDLAYKIDLLKILHDFEAKKVSYINEKTEEENPIDYGIKYNEDDDSIPISLK